MIYEASYRYQHPESENAGGGAAASPVGAFPAPGLAEGEAAVVAVRPQGVRLVPAARSDAGLEGRIIGRRFLGEVDHFDVAVEGLDAYLFARGRPREELRPGSEVRVTFDPRDVLVFRAGSD